MKIDEKGFSLLETLIVAGILAVLGLGIISTLNISLGTISYLNDRVEFLEFRSLLLKVYDQPQSCTNTVVGQSLSSVDFPLKDGANNTFATLGDLSTDSGLRVIGTSLSNPTGIPNGGSGNIQLVIAVERKEGGGGPKAFKPIDIDLPVVLNATGTISNCSFETNSYNIPITQLNLYISSFDTLSSCINIVGGSEYFIANTACSRFCNQSCVSVGAYTCKAINAGPVRPAYSHKSGLITECNSLTTPHSILCSCFN